MDHAHPKPKIQSEPEIVLGLEVGDGTVVESALCPGRPVSNAEIDAVLRLLGDDIASILR